MAQPTGLPNVARHYYDLISVTSLACDALAKIVTTYGDDLPTQCTNDMNVVIEGLRMQHEEALRYAPKLTELPLSREAYNLLRKDEPAPWESGAVPKRHRGRDEIWKMKCFNKVCKGKTQQKRTRVDPAAKEVNRECSPPKKKTRFAERVAERAACVSPFDDDEQVVSPDNNNTLGPKLTWTKSSLLDAMTGLIGSG